MDGHQGSMTLREVYGYDATWPRLPEPQRKEIIDIMCTHMPSPETPPHR